MILGKCCRVLPTEWLPGILVLDGGGHVILAVGAHWHLDNACCKLIIHAPAIALLAPIVNHQIVDSISARLPLCCTHGFEPTI